MSRPERKDRIGSFDHFSQSEVAALNSVLSVLRMIGLSVCAFVFFNTQSLSFLNLPCGLRTSSNV